MLLWQVILSMSKFQRRHLTRSLQMLAIKNTVTFLNKRKIRQIFQAKHHHRKAKTLCKCLKKLSIFCQPQKVAVRTAQKSFQIALHMSRSNRNIWKALLDTECLITHLKILRSQIASRQKTGKKSLTK